MTEAALYAFHEIATYQYCRTQKIGHIFDIPPPLCAYVLNGSPLMRSFISIPSIPTSDDMEAMTRDDTLPGYMNVEPNE